MATVCWNIAHISGPNEVKQDEPVSHEQIGPGEPEQPQPSTDLVVSKEE